MSKSKNKEISDIGQEFLKDFEYFSKKTNTKEKINKNVIITRN